ncbi:uncharacterized protein [Pseudochaenichthys georgianus]|uniref:uncharacterized protein n=1 Tax=Pseudochaenichthys georgianus TaxID=52239 RepID=UPI0039C15993
MNQPHMDPADDPFEVELYSFTYLLAHSYGEWRGATSAEQKRAALAEAYQRATEKPGLVKFLPGWMMDFLQTCVSRPASPRPASPRPASPRPASPRPASPRPASPRPASPRPASPRPASPRPASPLPATVPNIASFENAFDGSRLAFGGPRSLQKAPKRRRSRLPARAPAAMFPAPAPAPATMVQAPVPAHTAMVLCSSAIPHSHGTVLQCHPTQPWYRAPVPSHTAMVPGSSAIPHSHEPAHTAMVPASVLAHTAIVPAPVLSPAAIVPAPVLSPAAMVPAPDPAHKAMDPCTSTGSHSQVPGF